MMNNICAQRVVEESLFFPTRFAFDTIGCG